MCHLSASSRLDNPEKRIVQYPYAMLEGNRGGSGVTGLPASPIIF